MFSFSSFSRNESGMELENVGTSWLGSENGEANETGSWRTKWLVGLKYVAVLKCVVRKKYVLGRKM